MTDYIRTIRNLIGHTEITIPGARIVILNAANQVLLEERTDFNIWGLPGGSADPGENILQTIRREVLEETGLQIINPVPFGFSSSPQLERITFPNGDQIHSFNLLFYTREFGGELKLSEESSQLDWFELNQLPPMLENMENTVLAYREHAKTHCFQLVAGKG